MRFLPAFILLAWAAAAPGQPIRQSNALPPGLEGVGVTEKLNTQLPLDLVFYDESGQAVQLRQYFRGNQPVIIQLGYYGCPMLCGVVTNGLLDAIKESGLMPGREYQVINISIDPREEPALARAKKQTYLEALGNPAVGEGWHFLTGKQGSIDQITQATGFGYRWDAGKAEFSHAAVLVVATPDGRVSRYLYGVKYPSRTFRLSLVEASEGKIGSAGDQILLFCFHYDPGTGRYSLAAVNFMRLFGVLTVAVVGSLIARAVIRELRSRGRAAAAQGS